MKMLGFIFVFNLLIIRLYSTKFILHNIMHTPVPVYTLLFTRFSHFNSFISLSPPRLHLPLHKYLFTFKGEFLAKQLVKYNGYPSPCFLIYSSFQRCHSLDPFQTPCVGRRINSWQPLTSNLLNSCA